MSDINVVPYIDVMLVLLVIFMITAPLMTQGVKVDLPQASSKPLSSKEQHEPLIVVVDKKGQFFLSTGSLETKSQPISSQTLFNRVRGILRAEAATPVYIRGDKSANYGLVVETMSLLQNAGASSVGLITEPKPPAPVTKPTRRK
jgi:biopolymer transport protein TolR